MADDAPTLDSLFSVDKNVAKQCIFNAVDASIWDNVTIPRFFREAAAEKVAGKLDDLLAVPLADLLANAFNGCRDFTKYADNAPHDVKNFGFSLESEHEPYVELRVTGLPPQKVKFPVTLSLEFSGATLHIDKSRVMSLSGGDCTASGTLCCEKLELSKLPLEPVRLPGTISFGEGVPIPFAKGNATIVT
jgi:hypothetical protein